MALYDRRSDWAGRHQDAKPRLLATLLPSIVAAAIVVALMIAMLTPRTSERLGPINAGPQVKTVSPQPMPSTSPPVPTPTPTTEPRPTQAPIP